MNNTRNLHHLSQSNPYGMVETNIERRFSISLWCGMIDDMSIGTVILDGLITGQN
jgi:hypothetical protein